MCQSLFFKPCKTRFSRVLFVVANMTLYFPTQNGVCGEGPKPGPGFPVKQNGVLVSFGGGRHVGGVHDEKDQGGRGRQEEEEEEEEAKEKETEEEKWGCEKWGKLDEKQEKEDRQTLRTKTNTTKKKTRSKERRQQQEEEGRKDAFLKEKECQEEEKMKRRGRQNEEARGEEE